MQVQHEPK